MQAAAVDAVVFVVRFNDMNYNECLKLIQEKAGVIIEPIYRKPETIKPEAVAKLKRINKRIDKRALFIGLMHTL